MKIEDEILINQYGQDLVPIYLLTNRFEILGIDQERCVLNYLINLITQSKVENGDIHEAIKNSGLKPTYTPCVMLRKGVSTHLLERLVSLPHSELIKVFTLLLSLFKIGYKRRFSTERNNPNKWWYWDLSDAQRVELIIMRYSL